MALHVMMIRLISVTAITKDGQVSWVVIEFGAIFMMRVQIFFPTIDPIRTLTRGDGTGIEPHHALRRAACAQFAAAQARDRVWHFSDFGVVAIFGAPA